MRETRAVVDAMRVAAPGVGQHQFDRDHMSLFKCVRRNPTWCAKWPCVCVCVYVPLTFVYV